jgi:two-component system, response regulator, stage 0 sporulation protein F
MSPIKSVATLLIVDDEVELCSLLEYFFRECGYCVEVAYDGEDGIAKAKSTQPDLILLDIRMPVLDGLEALVRIKGWSDAPVIMMTALADMALFDKCLHARAHSYILKPFDLDNLQKVVEDVLWEESERQVSPILWSDELVTGYDEIDEDHKRLNQMLNQVNEGFNDRIDIRILQELFSDFLIHCREHFEMEEKFQEQIGYSEIESHEKDHQFILGEAKKIKDHLSAINEVVQANLDTLHLLQSFKILWYQHLMTADREFSIF